MPPRGFYLEPKNSEAVLACPCLWRRKGSARKDRMVNSVGNSVGNDFLGKKKRPSMGLNLLI